MELPQSPAATAPSQEGGLKASLLEKDSPGRGRWHESARRGMGGIAATMTEGVCLVESKCWSKCAGGKESI